MILCQKLCCKFQQKLPRVIRPLYLFEDFQIQITYNLIFRFVFYFIFLHWFLFFTQLKF